MEKHIEPHVAREQVESKAKEEKLIDRWMKIKIGSVPLPVYIVLSTVIVVTGLLQQLPVNMLGGFAVILTLGWLLGTIGATILYQEFRWSGNFIFIGSIYFGFLQLSQSEYS